MSGRAPYPMGNYSIIINGKGPIYNDNAETDADKLTAALVASLQAKGHTITNANFSSNDSRSVLPVVEVIPPANS